MSVAGSGAADVAAAQSPSPGTLTLDHVAHFVPDMDAAAPVFEKLGFTLTPFSAQSQRLEPDAPPTEAGSGNRCVMLAHGYVECLTPVGETAIAAQLRAAINRYVGVHLIAFGTAAPDRDHARLSQQGYAPGPPIALQRQIETPHGDETARFTVLRVPPGTMREGRIQFCRHHTPELVWQPRWVAHANRATALTAVMLCVEDPGEAAARYARFTGLPAAGAGDSWHLDTHRGRLLFSSPSVIERVFSIAPPAVPWIAGYFLATSDPAETRKSVAATGYAHGELGGQRLYVVPPSITGGIVVFESNDSAAMDLRLFDA